MGRTLSRDRVIGVKVQSSGEGVPATGVASADLIQATSFSATAGQPNLERSDFGAGFDKFGFVQGGTLQAEATLGAHLVLPGSFAVPQHDKVFLSAFSISAAVSISTTISDTTPTTTAFDLTSAAGIQAGDILAVDVGSGVYEMRPVASVSAPTVNFAIAFSAIPANGATVRAKIYRLSTTSVFLTLFDFLDNRKHQIEDALVNELTFTFEDIVNFSATMLASNLTTTAEAEPSAPAFAGDAFARNFGGVWMDRTTASAASFKTVLAYELAIRLLNNAVRNPAEIGSLSPDGVSRGLRDVRVDITLPLGTPAGDNTEYLDDSISKTAQRLFVHGSRSASFAAGYNVGFHIPKLELARPSPELDTDDPATVLNFTDSAGFATTSNDSLVMAFA